MGSYRSGAAMSQIMLTEWEWPDEPRFLMCTPLSHAGAAFFIPVLLLGGSLVVLPYFEPGLVLETIERERITATMVVPTMLYMLMDHPDFATRDLSSLETVYYGAAAMSPTRLAEAIDKLGPIFFQYYGQAEAPMTICVLRKDEHDVARPERLATCGRPVPWVHVALLDDFGNEVPRGEPGEICVRGPLVMQGYWNKPEQTAEAFAGGWLHTGDIAREDDEGYYTIVDRKKDMIVSGGFNVFPREVEDVISSHPSVAAVAVIGVPDDRWGEAVKAVVVPRPGAEIVADELIELVKRAKGSVHAPKSVDVAESIPLSPLGKPDKKALRAQYWQDADRLVN
jgi:fatty-acyl-CoA synthase